MKSKNIIFIILLCTICVACGEDRRKEYLEFTASNRWIDSVMRENYYWYEDIPKVPNKDINFFIEESSFLSKILSSKDKGYSHIEDLDPKTSYGIEYDASLRYNDTAYALRVLYVDTDSPAQDINLKRGDWITKWKGDYIVRTQVDSLLKGEAVELTLGEYTVKTDGENNTLIEFPDKRTVTIGAARVTKNNPVFANTYTVNGEKVGYLYYSQFKSGESESDLTYDNLLRDASNRFITEGIKNLILDLRYNTGGSLESAQLLGSILVPQAALGKTMSKIEYSDKLSAKNREILFSNEVLNGGKNLDLDKIYIITGSYTGPTSDVLINCIKTYIGDQNTILIGATTKGNHTGTHAFPNNEFRYILHPVDCIIKNAEGTIPESGYSPTYSVKEFDAEKDIVFHPIGNINEALLAYTLKVIEGVEPTSRSNTSIWQKEKAPGFCTLDRIPIRGTSIR